MRLCTVATIVLLGLFFVVALGRAWDQQAAQAGSPPVRKQVSSADVVDGHDVHWWARHSRYNGRLFRQADKDRDARGRTIRRLQHAQLHASAHFFSWLAAADCVHRHESIRWDYNGHTYDGGMQADWAFQTTYAPDLIRRYGGPAYIWPWYAQLQMAYRGWLFRGWQPWPATSRMCGLR